MAGKIVSVSSVARQSGQVSQTKALAADETIPAPPPSILQMIHPPDETGY